jgi:hypothetical protein
MRILVACEESQTVCNAFRVKGHEAYSCDILPTSGDHPEWHLHGDFRKWIFDGWEMLIAHPPCTFLCNSGVRWLKGNPQRFEQMMEATRFFKVLWGMDEAGIPQICVENPIPHKYAKLPAYTQIIQPWQFGHKEIKATCLWLKGLPPLKPTNIVGPPPKDRDKSEWDKVHRASPGPGRAKMRSKTPLGYAEAMASQWNF